MTVIAVLSVLFGLFVVSVPSLIRHFAFESMSPGERTRLDALMKTPVTFPPEWQKVTPFSPQVLAAAERMNKALDTVGPRAISDLRETTIGAAMNELQRGGAISSDQWSSISEILKAANPILQETSTIVHLPDYSAESVSVDGMWSGMTGRSAGSIYIGARLWCAAAHQDANSGNWQDAFADLDSAFRTAQTEEVPYDSPVRLSVYYIRYAANATAVLATSCTEVETLRKSLNSLSTMRPNLIHLSSLDPLVANSVGKLRRYARDKYPSNLEPGHPGAFYVTQAAEAEYYKYPKFMAENLPISDPRRDGFEKAVQMMESSGGPFRMSALLKAAFGMVPDVAMRFMINVNRTELKATERTAAEVDLARLALAARLYQLEKGTSVTSVNELVPAYFPEAPKDPFSGKPFSYDSASGRFYSVGPDGKDDRLTVFSRDGDMSGDIALGDPRQNSVAYW